MPSLVLTRKVGQAVVLTTVTERIVVRVESGKGPDGAVRLSFEADAGVAIVREEIEGLREQVQAVPSKLAGKAKGSFHRRHGGTESQGATRTAL